MIGRFLCILGFHRWVTRTEVARTVVITYKRCARLTCAAYADEFVVDLERRACACRRYSSPSPLCPIHGQQAAA